MAKKIEMLFYKTDPSPQNTGLKFVLWEVTDIKSKVVTHDWGFSSWLGEKWDVILIPPEYEAKVIWWSNTVNPQLLLKEKSKIIRLN